MAIKAPKLSAEDLVHLADQKQLIVALEPRKSLPVLVSTCTQCMCLVYNFIKIITYVWEKENYFESTKRLFCVHESHHKKKLYWGPLLCFTFGWRLEQTLHLLPTKKKKKDEQYSSFILNTVECLFFSARFLPESIHSPKYLGISIAFCLCLILS